MKVPFALTLLLPLAASAQWTATGPLSGPAREAHIQCSTRALQGLLEGKGPRDSAQVVATTAEGLCSVERMALQKAVEQDNQPHGQAAQFSRAFTEAHRKELITRLTAAALTGAPSRGP